MRNIFSFQAGHAGPISKNDQMLQIKRISTVPLGIPDKIAMRPIWAWRPLYIYNYNQFQPLQQQPSQVQSSSLSQPTRSSLPSVLFGASFARRVVRFCALNLWHRSGTKPLYSTGPLNCGTQNSSGREIHSAGSVHWCLGGARYRYPQTALDVKLGRNGKPKPS